MDEPKAKKPHQLTNREFAVTIKAMRDGCERAGIPATKRQASKWRNKRGIAFKTANKGAK